MLSIAFDQCTFGGFPHLPQLRYYSVLTACIKELNRLIHHFRKNPKCSLLFTCISEGEWTQQEQLKIGNKL